jgi:hypothetical protein
MAEVAFHGRIMHRFVETLSSEIGHETFSAVLSKAGLPEEWAHPSHFAALDDSQMAQAYANLHYAHTMDAARAEFYCESAPNFGIHCWMILPLGLRLKPHSFVEFQNPCDANLPLNCLRAF